VSGAAPKPQPGGFVHTYQRYDPVRFPPPRGEAPDLASAAMEHMLWHGSTRRLTPEELARAVKLDVSQIAGLGPSLDSLIARLEERKRKILETYETERVLKEARRAVGDQATQVELPKSMRDELRRAVRQGQLHDLERLWERAGGERDGANPALLNLIERLGEQYQVEALASAYAFSGREAMDVSRALEIKDELEAIDRLLAQLREALKNAQVAMIDLDELARFAQESEVQQLRDMAAQLDEFMREEARRQGLEDGPSGYTLSPKAMRTFQSKVLSEIFSSLQASRSGRHTGPIVGEGPVELARTKDYEFGDSPAHMDVAQTLLNASARAGGIERNADAEGGARFRLRSDDIAVHRTRNNPKCATCVLLDMSGSMRNDAQYVHAKRMALGLDALVRREYPGDFLRFVEVYSFAKVRAVSEIPALMPKPVTIRRPVVRLMADMSDPSISESMVPPHFTNIQHALNIARRLLGAQETPNRQVILITDGLPTAHFDGPRLLLLYPPDPATEEATMREAMACAREGITINIFLLPSWSQTSEDVAFAHTIAERTGGRVFFTGGADLDRFVLWDYVSHRRTIIG
jgi:uncharacterized protein with von Willebrand factor type A (vWA) domain